MNELFNKINEYNQIIIYRHINPDLDAFGCQFGVYLTLKNLYPNKNILMQGNMTSDLLRLYPSYIDHQLNNEKTLGIVLDTANRDRIDGDISLCDYIIKIDHHIIVDSYGDINIEIETASSCSEIVTLLFKENNIKLNEEAANALYLGIVGDSNRFLYDSTSASTFLAAMYLLSTPIHISELYEQLYLKDKNEINILKYIYNNYHEDEGIAYFILTDEDLKQLNITREEASNYVSALANIKDYPIWMAITQNILNNNYRVSIRSRNIAINQVASEFRGGGHAFASGGTLESLDELPLLIQRLKEKIYE